MHSYDNTVQCKIATRNLFSFITSGFVRTIYSFQYINAKLPKLSIRSSYRLGRNNECSVCCRWEPLMILSAITSIRCAWLRISSAPSSMNRLYEVSTSNADLTSLAVGFLGTFLYDLNFIYAFVLFHRFLVTPEFCQNLFIC